MQWTEVSLQTTHEQADTIADILYSAGAQGVAMEDPLLINQLRASGTWELCDIPEQQNTEVVTVTAYYPDDEKLSERLEFISREVKAVEERIGQKYVFRNPLFRTLCEQDWANEWKQYFHVTHIGKHLVIKPSWVTTLLLKLTPAWPLAPARTIQQACVWNTWKKLLRRRRKYLTLAPAAVF